MLTLYHTPQSRSVRPRWLLEELGVPYEVKRVDLAAGEQKRPEYLRLNPNGAVPTLVDGDLVVFESAAICQYLTDRHPEKRLAPPVGSPARAHYYQWVHYAMSGLEPPILTIFMHTIRRPEADRIPSLVAEARPQLAAALAVVDRALEGRPFILGTEFSTADVMLGSLLGWARRMRIMGDDVRNVSRYVGELTERPAFLRATAD